MPNKLGYPKSGWQFVVSLRFEQTKNDGRKVFFNHQDVSPSTHKKILSILRSHSDRIEFHDETKLNKPPRGGILDITAEGKHFSGKVYTQKARFSWQFKKSILLLLPGMLYNRYAKKQSTKGLERNLSSPDCRQKGGFDKRRDSSCR